MNTTSQLSGTLRSALERPTRGVVGLVDDLLRLCPEQGLRLDWRDERCRIRSLTGSLEELLDLPLRKSIFRAILARVAALCNERSPSSVSPYGGQGELLIVTEAIGGDFALGDRQVRRSWPPVLFRVSFANTADEHKLELVPGPGC